MIISSYLKQIQLLQFSPTRSRVHLRPCTPYKSRVRLIQFRVNVWTVSIRLYYKTLVRFKRSLLTALQRTTAAYKWMDKRKKENTFSRLYFLHQFSKWQTIVLMQFCSLLFDKRCTLSRITCKYFNFNFFPLIICNICGTGDQIICPNLFCNFCTSEWMS